MKTQNSTIVDKKTLKIDRDDAINMFNSGSSYSEIGRKYNCTAWAVQKLLKNKKNDFQKPINIELLEKINYEKLLKMIKFFVRNYQSILSFDFVLDSLITLPKRYNEKILTDIFPERKAIDFALSHVYYKINTIETNIKIENYEY